MNLTTSPIWLGGYEYHIAVNSPFYVNALNALNTTKYKVHLYCWNGNRNITTPIEPIITLEKEVLNQNSFYFNISDYLIPHISPEINSVQQFEVDLAQKWVAWTIQYYRLNAQTNVEEIFQTFHSNLYVATYGFSWFNRQTPSEDSQKNEYPIFLAGDKDYKLKHLPITVGDLNYYFNYNFSHEIIYPNQIVEYHQFTPQEMTNAQCDYDYQIIFINRFGAFETFPLYGKTVVNHSTNKQNYTALITNNGYTRLKNYKPEISQKSSVKYSYNSMPFDDEMFLKIEEIIHSPLLLIYNCATKYTQHVYIPSVNYQQKTWRNDKHNTTYSLEFVSVFDKKK